MVACGEKTEKLSENLGKGGHLLLLTTALTISHSRAQTLVYGSFLVKVVGINTLVDGCS